MIPTLAHDSRQRPDLFQWKGPIEDDPLRAWMTQHALDGHCPPELVSFWKETGGGDLFETETILGPFGDRAMGDDVMGAALTFRTRGMPDNFLPFHVGMAISVVDLAVGDYVELAQDDFKERRRFRSLDEWYTSLLRSEYAVRYGLR